MWFWLMVIIFVVGICLVKIGQKYWDRNKHPFLYHNDDAIKFAGVLTSVISALAVIIMLVCIVCSHTNVEANLEENREIYDALTYKMESTTCRDEFGFLSKEVIDEVQEWNKDVRYYQSAQDDFWVGIFYPNVFDEFETIDYESYKSN